MSGIAAAELAIQRTLTKEFIRADSMEIVLERAPLTADGEGGWVRGTPTPLPAQTMRLIPLQDGTPGGQNRFTADGEAVRPGYMLMGLHTADMQRHDRFTTAEGNYEIVFVNANRQYEVKGEVYRYGR